MRLPPRPLALLMLLPLAIAPARAQDGMTCPAPVPARLDAGIDGDMAPPFAAPAFFVAPEGDDAGDGSPTRPFATLRRARDAMRGSPVRTTYLATGTWRLQAPLELGAADSATSYIARTGAQPVLDGSGRADSLLVLRGARGVTIAGLTLQQAGAGGAVFLEGGGGHRLLGNMIRDSVNGMVLDGSSGNAIIANRIRRSDASAIEAKDAANANLFDSNEIDVTCAIGTKGGGIFLHGGDDNVITHNLISNTAGMGIGVLNWDVHTVNLRTVVHRNVVRAANRMSFDSGAIYLLGRSHRDMQTVVDSNLIDGAGSERDHAIGIYLDDSTSGVRVTGNIVRRPGTHAVQVHGGDGITIAGNILDLGHGRASAVLFQSAPADTNPSNTMLDNLVSGNIVLSRSSSAVVYEHIEGGTPAVRGNLYHSTAGVALMAGDVVVDSAPIFADPGFRDAPAGDYRLPPNAAALAWGFRPIDAGRMGPRAALPGGSTPR